MVFRPKIDGIVQFQRSMTGKAMRIARAMEKTMRVRITLNIVLS